MTCTFCHFPIHFFEDFYVIRGTYFHEQVVTDTAIRCKRVLHPPKVLLDAENRLKGERHELPRVS